jgi:hypothetical protein
MVLHPLGDVCRASAGTSPLADDSLYLDDAITQHLIKYGQYIPVIDLGFAISELCQAFREYPQLKDELIENIKERRHGMAKEDATYLETENKFFSSQLRRNKVISRECAKEIEYIECEFPIFKNKELLKDDEIRKEIEQASELSGISEASTGVLNMLVFNGERVIRIVQDSQKLTLKYRRWLSAIRETGIYSPWTHGKILERKKTYILKKYGKSSNELMKETLESIRITAIRYID